MFKVRSDARESETVASRRAWFSKPTFTIRRAGRTRGDLTWRTSTINVRQLALANQRLDVAASEVDDISRAQIEGRTRLGPHDLTTSSFTRTLM